MKRKALQDLAQEHSPIVVGSRVGNAAAVSLLQSRGVDVSSVRQVLLPEPGDWADDMLQEAAGQLRIALGQPEMALQVDETLGSSQLQTLVCPMPELAIRSHACSTTSPPCTDHLSMCLLRLSE